MPARSGYTLASPNPRAVPCSALVALLDQNERPCREWNDGEVKTDSRAQMYWIVHERAV